MPTHDACIYAYLHNKGCMDVSRCVNYDKTNIYEHMIKSLFGEGLHDSPKDFPTVHIC